MITQTRLDRFFLVPQSYTPSKCSLTDLPPNVRSQIYSYLHLVRDGHIHLNVTKFGENREYVAGPISDCCCLNCVERYPMYNKWSCSLLSPLPLLLTCRTLYQEMCPILYSSNHFTISRNSPGGLGGMFSLRALALASLTSLTIAVNKCKIYDADNAGQEVVFYDCGDCAGWEEVDGDDIFETASEECTEHPTIKSVIPLGCVSRSDRGIISEWNRLCKHIACSIPPNRLRLCLICDVKDVETAQEVIKPMRQLPILLACSIRLSTETDHRLRCMAVKATRELTGKYSSLPPSPRLPQLPHEIQIQILQHTDLVAPHDLRWAPEQGLICLSKSPNEKNSVWAQNSVWPQNPHALNTCEVCFSVHKPRQRFERQVPKIARASQCWCWRFPTELFLVSSAYHRESTRIFYSSNHFYIYGGINNCWNERDMCPRFIQQLPRDARQYLRSLQFLLPVSARWPEGDWKEELLILSRSVELSRLTVTIDESLWRGRDTSYGWSTAIDEISWQRTQGVVEPFMKLGRLKDFFVHLGYPMTSRDSEELRNRREKILERRVMGSDYDSEERGKYLHRHRLHHPPDD